MKRFLKVDKYIQIFILCTFALGWLIIDFNQALGSAMICSLPIWHIVSFMIRLFLPYPKSVFYKIYGIYLALFYTSFLVEPDFMSLPNGIFAFLSIPAGFVFINICFWDYNEHG